MLSHPEAFALVREKWATQQRQKATRGDVITLLREIARIIPGCTLILDGLDECSWVKDNQKPDDGDSLDSFMEALAGATTDQATRILIVSRDEPEIRTCLSHETGIFPCSEYKITPEDVESDIISFSRNIVHRRLPKKPDTMKEDLTQKLAGRSNGQFMWVKMLEDSLRGGKNQKQLEQAINSTPNGLHHIYERNWMKIERLSEEDRERAISLLRWTTFALRPLTVSEMVEALLISQNCDEFREDELPDAIDMDYIETEIFYYCGSLLEVRSSHAECPAGMRTVHLAHFSVKEFLRHKLAHTEKIMQLTGAIGSFTEDEARVRNTIRSLALFEITPPGHGSNTPQLVA
ncbi:hypothetical protein BJX63DRAFT_422112 [Aspergillus granulosus]|uniref:GPI inositol-deacylase winged helix domain-containing protein n=1 Tax=Aspergillus granulosus TaxID=176169 RepID=A0ABR4H8V3_9EURO